jgi:hypothetical protein
MELINNWDVSDLHPAGFSAGENPCVLAKHRWDLCWRMMRFPEEMTNKVSSVLLEFIGVCSESHLEVMGSLRENKIQHARQHLIYRSLLRNYWSSLCYSVFGSSCRVEPWSPFRSTTWGSIVSSNFMHSWLHHSKSRSIFIPRKREKSGKPAIFGETRAWEHIMKCHLKSRGC